MRDLRALFRRHRRLGFGRLQSLIRAIDCWSPI
jgi:hypothetical protein